MPEITLTQKQMELIAFDICEGEEQDGIRVVEAGDWIDGGKSSYQSIIFRYEDKFYEFGHSRSGSPFTDYHYDVQEGYAEARCHEVEQVEQTVTVWQAVKE